jgi:phosphoribosylamine--glycine ligase
MVIPLIPARDHKRIYDNDEGPNTGGMGAYAPVPDITPEQMEEITHRILQPVIDGMKAQGTPYAGILYAGLMLTPDGIKVIEFNCRFGDPETQAVIPLLQSDLFEIMYASAMGHLDRITLEWNAGACATVVASAPGYPGTYPKGLPISGIEGAARLQDTVVFHAGTRRSGEQILTDGGRVLAVSAIGNNLRGAIDRAYEGMQKIHFEGMHYRHDIGKRVTGERP